MQHASERLDQERGGTGLDRSLNLTAIPFEWVAWVVVVLATALIRLPGRTNWPLSPAESTIARDAWALLQGNDLSAVADAHPVVVQIAAFLYFLFGDTEYTSRLLPLLSGIAILGILFWLRNWFGKVPALSIAIVWALSPVMTLSALRLDAGTVLLPAMLLILSLTLAFSVESSRASTILFGIAIAVGLTTHPIAWVVIPLTLLSAMVMVRDFRLGGQLVPISASAALSLLVITSWFATRPVGIWNFLSESLSILWNNHILEFGADWQVPLLVLIIDEPVIVILTVIGVTVTLTNIDWDLTVPPAIVSSALVWAFPLLAVGVLLGGKGPALYSVTLFPLVVVAGLALSMLFDGCIKGGWQRGVPLLWSVVLIALLIAIVRFIDLLARGPSEDDLGWLINAGILGLLVILPLGYGGLRLAGGIGSSLLPTALLTLVVLTGVISLRTSILLPSTENDRPGTILLAGSSSPAVGRIEHRLQTYSRDASAQSRDVQDPQGGHGLTILLDEQLSDPLAWYLREFPNLLIVHGPEDVADGSTPDAIIVPARDRDRWGELFPEHQGRDYAARFLSPDEQSSTLYRDLLISALNPLEFRNLVNFAVYRNTPQVLEQQEMTLFLRAEHAIPIWGDAPQNPTD